MSGLLQLKKQRSLSSVIFAAVTLCIAFELIIAVIIVAYFSVRFVVEETGRARIDVLEQISDINSTNRLVMENVMDQVYDKLYDQLLTAEIDEEQLQASLDGMQATLNSVGMDATIDVVINARQVYMTANETEESIRNLLNSYWYIKHYSGETAESWNLRFIDAQDVSSYYLSYGRTVYSADGNSVAVIVINMSQDTQFRALQKLVGDRDKVYILDRNGIIICHSNSAMVGNWMTSMNTFESTYGVNTSQLVIKREQKYMISNYQDPASGWTFVEEQNISDFLSNVAHVLVMCISAILLTGMAVVWVAYNCVRRIMRDLTNFTERINQMSPEALEVLPVESRYQEVSVLGVTFNKMVVEVQKLIQNIQEREAEKLRSEYDFLQAQMSPHFMQNTLIAIKSLMSMGRLQEAGSMMSEFVELLHIPTTPEIPLVALREELHLLDSFVAIMNCRTDKNVEFVHDIPEKIQEILVPRMLLQPLVGNAFFHGFAERDKDCRIQITASVTGRVLEIIVEDNGEGITPARLQEISSSAYAPEGHHHGVGLQNVKKRLGIVYGGSSSVVVQSIYGKFTRVVLRIDDYDHPLMNLAAQRFVRNEFTEEERNEDSGS